MALTRVETLTIANGATTSDEFSAGWHAAYGLVVPAAFTGTSISFTVCADTSVPVPVYQALYEVDDPATGTQRQVTMAVTQGRSYDLPAALTTWQAFKIVSNGAEAADRSLVVVGKAP